MDLAKYRGLFVSEAREHVEGLNRHLLALEKAPADRQALDGLFRLAHSIKGMSAAMGFDAVADLAHRLEDLADCARQGAPFDQEAVDLWMEGVDWLTGQVRMVAENRDAEMKAAPFLALVRDKAKRMAGHLPAGSAPTQGRTMAVPAPLASDVTVTTSAAQPTAQAPVTETMPAVAVSGARWNVEVDIRPQAQTPHVRAFLVHKRVSEKMTILRSTPDPAELKRGILPERRLAMVVQGSLAPQELEMLIRDIPDVLSCRVLLAQEPVVSPQATTAVRAAPAPDAARTVRVRTEVLDRLIDSVGEILLARSRLRALATRLDEPELQELADEFNRLAQGLHDRVLTARMTPISVLTDRLPRTVRDLARKHGREVDFAVEGADIELDRAILDELHDPVLHLVRNAVDHAHAGNHARVSQGKRAAMSLKLSASRDRDHVLISLSDDGKGMDPAHLRQVAINRGILSADAARHLTDQAALELICRPGFSTAAEVNDTSGRGVGMDVVRAKAESLGGQLLIESALGRGTTFTLRLPLTVAIIRVLLVSAGDSSGVFALPLHRVGQALDFQPKLMVTAQGQDMYPLESGLCPLHHLSVLLGYNVHGTNPGTVVIMEQALRPLAIRVDAIVGQQEVVVKPLGEPLSNVSYLAGAALLADGRPAYILDVAKLVATAQTAPSPAAEAH